MAISRGQYGMASRVTTEYYVVEYRYANGNCSTDLIAGPTRNICYAQAARQNSDAVKITLHPCEKERYDEEMANAAYWAKHRGSARGPEPIC